MVLFADDLIVHKKGLESLILQATGGFAGQWVISGICNFDMWMNVDKYCFKPNITWHSGEFPPINLAGYVQKHKEALLFQELDLMRVTFNGFACMVVPRWIVEAIPFRYDNESGAGVDQNFCDDVRNLDAGFGSKVELLVDINVRFIHLAQRTMDGKLECSGLGIKKPQELFIHGLEVKEMIYQL